MWPTWRISPPRPTSPHTTKSPGAGVFVAAETSARHKPRSLPGSFNFTPPTTDAYTSCCDRLMRARRSRTASNIAKRPGSRPCALRRAGALPDVALVSACTSTSNGRWPSSVGTTTEPGVPGRRSAKNILLASGTPTKPSSVISNKPSSLVEPKRCFTARIMRSA